MRDKCAANYKIVTSTILELRTVRTERAARAKVLTIENIGGEDIDLMVRYDELLKTLLDQLRHGCMVFLRAVKAKNPSLNLTGKKAASSFPEAGSISNLNTWIQRWNPGFCIEDAHIQKLMKAFENAPVFGQSHSWTTTSKSGQGVVLRPYTKSKPRAAV